jgi:hypothetical protein
MRQQIYDAVNVEHIPYKAKHVAGYVDGYANVPELRQRFPRATLTTITVHGTIADVLDVEKGTVSLTYAVEWVKNMRHLGRRPIVYCSRSNWLPLREIFRNAKVKDPFWWIADWTNEPHLLPGSIATQWQSSPAGYDQSSAAKGFPKAKLSLYKRIVKKLNYIQYPQAG